MFKDRMEAGMALTEKLKKYKKEEGLVLAVPRGGVPIAYVVAKELGFPLDIVLTKKIGHPANKEYAIGAVSMTDSYIIPHENVSDKYVEAQTLYIRQRLKEMYSKFMGDKAPEPMEGKTVIVIDDGIATGNTLMATVQMLRRSNPAKIVIAVPVASSDSIRKLSPVVDELICLLVPELFFGVGAFYEDFTQVSDQQVMDYLDKLRQERDKRRA
ncbi:MAG TPA: phosphoribosyltransferase family protein [Chitinophagaceae bacterium]|nr:phosphoribosyltransferase family protein [Chitinophagaceae bacterium]